ncbi:beta-N-acetylhexosaminidase [Sphingobacteriaceae bacterium WQ 2009]|uniref:beta-N-acetylhexosaminidase n=1 Tax=Rhinopithecimicrobium faecis TaxID=2820698 RepID=A0A8T4HGB2_9SPHI|nr:beta-N-acetylhexosaminidase [Sphingobacteriaceae bacterium WQ 2009]
MNKKLFTVAAIMLSTVYTLQAQSDVTIIPKPQELIAQKGQFELNAQTGISFSKSSLADVSLFVEQLRKVTKFPLAITKNKTNTIHFSINTKLAVPHPEGYQINVTGTTVDVQAKTAQGLFYASQTLRQLLPTAFEAQHTAAPTKWDIPAVAIKDFPRYNWRGYMKDVSRTFYDVDVIKKYLDVMAMYKLNTFHWHLTDDQGWRIEIKKYPKLTDDRATKFHHTENQPAYRSGFYTQAQIAEVVAYAKQRNITIVPEIDVPGHSWPTILSYPELGVNGNTYPNHIFPFVSSWAYWGVQFTPNTLDPSSEKVYEFLDNVFTEIAALFPGQYIHFGGDEVRHEVWEKEPHVVQFMKDHKLANVKELQSYFVKRVSDIIVKKGKTPLGWNDILADAKSLPKTTAIMSWLGESSIKEATSQGFKAVATPASHLYFDISQADRNDGTPSDLGYSNTNSLEVVYNYDPSAGLTPAEEKLVLGVQANHWTALTQELKDMNVHNFPRLLALSEVAWSAKSGKDYVKFQERLAPNLARLDSLKVDYYRPGGYIRGQWTPKDIQPQYADLKFDVTKEVYANGAIQAGFLYVSGKNYLEIEQVELLADGQVIAVDNHHALADRFRGTHKVKTYFYKFKLDSYNPASTYHIRAKVRGVGGTDSNGNFTFTLSPSKRFEAVGK